MARKVTGTVTEDVSDQLEFRKFEAA
jgi:hypothetical protein